MAEAGVGPADPAIPGSATRARAAVSAAPATNLVGRTIGARYSKRRIRGAPGARRGSGRPAGRSADDEHLVGQRLDGADAVIRPGQEEDPPAVAGPIGRRLRPDELPVRDREPGRGPLAVQEWLL